MKISFPFLNQLLPRARSVAFVVLAAAVWPTVASTEVKTPTSASTKVKKPAPASEVMAPTGVSARVAVIYDESFTSGQEASAQAKQDWINFRTSLSPSAYDTVTIKGTFDTTGRTLTDAAIVPQIAAALKNATGFSATAGGFTWSVGTCGNETAVLTARPVGDLSTCVCDNPAYTVRPNIDPGNPNWGGVNTPECNGPSQNIIVIFSGPSCMTDYSVSQSSGATIDPGTTDIGNNCDDCTTNITLPFPVVFYDQVFTAANVSSNGTLQFVSNNASYSNDCLPDGGFSYTIFPFWDDLFTADPANGEGIFTSVSGSTPNRIFNIEWRTVYCCTGGAPINDFEVRLYEGQRKVDVIYGSPMTDRGSATVGVQKDSADFTQFECSTPGLLVSGLQATFTTCTPPPANMVSWWPGDGDGTDIVSHNDLSFFGGSAAFVPGEVGQAFNFTGGQAATPGLPANLNITGNQVTIDGWVNPNVNNPQGVFFGKSESGENDYALFILSGQLASCIKTSDNVEHFLFSGGYFPPMGQWTHIAMTYDGTNETLYANGAVIAQQPVSGNIQGDGVNFWIGGRSSGGDLTINSAIDEVEVFDRALLPEEIAAIYNAGPSGKCKPQGPTLSTTASASTPIGGAISDTATLSGATCSPTGSITFNVYGPDDLQCANNPAFTSTVTVNGNGTYMSDPYTPTTAGTYQFIASYSGDSSNAAVSGNCGDANESVVVSKLTPTFSTTASSGTIIGNNISDTATLSSGFQPTGTITFMLFGPNDPSCGNAAIFTSTVAVNGNGDYTSASYTTTAPGTYQWVASYSGDANNNAVSGSCGDGGESVAVSKVTPSISTTASSGTAVGQNISDTATLASGFQPTGSITFRLFAPNDPSCGNAAIFTSTVAVNGNGNYTSASYTTTVAGTYHWVASYSGDANNNVVSGTCGDGGESVVVSKVTPTFSTTASPAVTAGHNISDTATLSSGFNPTGTITFRLFGPNQATCAGAPIFTSTVAVNGNGNYTSGSFTANTAGTYHWIASYSGDANNNAVSGNCGDGGESVAVGKLTPTVGTVASPNTTHLGATVTDTATVSGGSNPTGTITFRLFGPNQATCGGAPVFTSTKTLSAHSATSDPFVPTTPGTYRWIASYNGDANNNPVAGTCNAANESVVVLPAATSLTGTGTINSPLGGSASFIVNAQFKNGVSGKVNGNIDYNDPNAGFRLTQMKITSMAFTGDCVHITGTARFGTRNTVSITVDACDIAPPGTDSFAISLSNGYSASGNLTSGQIVFH